MQRLFWGCMAALAAVGVAGTATADDAYCREYQRNITIGGETVKSHGTACMQPDGSWKLMSDAEEDSNLQLAGLDVTPVIVEEPIVYRYYEGPSWDFSLDWDDDEYHPRHHGRHGRHGHW